MKEIIVSLFLSLFAVNAFAVTAEQLLRKSESKDLISNINLPSYEVEYEYINSADKDIIVNIKETVDGTKSRMECISRNLKTDGYFYSSLIINDEATYVSNKHVSLNGTIVFNDYKVVNDTKTVSSYSDIAGEEYLYSSLNVSFDPEQTKNKKEYIVVVSVKDAEKVKEDFRNKLENKNKEELRVEDFALYFMADFDSRIFIDRNTLLTNSVKIQISQEAAYKSVSSSEEHKDKSEEERRKIAKEILSKGSLFCETIYSDYKKADGTKLFYPSETCMKSPLFKEYSADGIYYMIRTKYFKALKSDEVDPAVFMPTNTKKGKGKVPKEFSYNANMYGVMLTHMKKEIMKSLKESIKETVKDEGKNMVKEGAKSVTKSIFKGLSGF